MKVEQVLAQAPKILSQAQREFYFENGYLMLEGLISGDRLARLKPVTQDFIVQPRSVPAA